MGVGTGAGMGMRDMDADEADASDVELRLVPDLAGAAVEDAVGFPIGSVYATVAEADTGLIRYLDVALERSGRHVLVPIGHVRVDADGKDPLRMRAATLEELEHVPTFYEDDTLGDEEQERVLVAYGRSFYGERYYAHPAFDHHYVYAGEQPITVGPPPAPGTGPLFPLSDLDDYDVAEGEHDFRGWPLHGLEGTRVGTVRELLVDTTTAKVRYAIVQLDGDAHLTPLPIGYLRVHDESTLVRTPALTGADLHALPAFPEGDFTRDDEESLREALERRLAGARRFGRADFQGHGAVASAPE